MLVVALPAPDKLTIYPDDEEVCRIEIIYRSGTSGGCSAGMGSCAARCGCVIGTLNLVDKWAAATGLGYLKQQLDLQRSTVFAKPRRQVRSLLRSGPQAGYEH